MSQHQTSSLILEQTGPVVAWGQWVREVCMSTVKTWARQYMLIKKITTNREVILWTFSILPSPDYWGFCPLCKAFKVAHACPITLFWPGAFLLIYIFAKHRKVNKSISVYFYTSSFKSSTQLDSIL